MNFSKSLNFTLLGKYLLKTVILYDFISKNLYLSFVINNIGDLMDNNAQASAELILLFGGIMVVVLLAIYMYKTYVMDLGGEIKSKEVNEFNAKLEEISEIFT